jgi:hypothetical protein
MHIWDRPSYRWTKWLTAVVSGRKKRYTIEDPETSLLIGMLHVLEAFLECKIYVTYLRHMFNPMTELADCGEPAISLHSHHVSLVQWTTCLLPVTRDPGLNPLGGYLCEIWILLLALSHYIGDPDVIDHFCGLV